MKQIQPKLTIRPLFSYIILSLIFAAPTFVSGQNIVLSSQAEVDAFSLTEVTGSLTISGADITNLDGLSSLTSVASDFLLAQNDALLNLDGLEAITSVGGGLGILNNDLLLNLDGLGALTSVTDLRIEDNRELLNLDALAALTSVRDLRIVNNINLLNINGLAAITTVTGSLFIGNIPRLYNLDALSAITSVGSDITIITNGRLLNLNGLAAITSVTGDLKIAGNGALLNLDDLSAITSVGGNLVIEANPLLQNLDGLSAITSVGSLTILRNPGLLNLDALSAITSISGALAIFDNDGLLNLDGLAAITSVGGLSIINNSGLLNLDGLTGITSVGGSLSIINNSGLLNLDGLAAITSVEGLIIDENPSLLNLDGLSNIASAGHIRINNNNAILNLGGLAAITSEVVFLDIRSNNALINLDGLSGITSVTRYLRITNNIALTSFCGLFPLFEGGSYNNASISGNAVNPTISEIIANGACVSITCPSDVTVFTDPGICCAAISLAPPTVHGGNSNTTLVNDYNNTSDASDTYFVMTTVVTWTATDAYGNQSTCTQNITVMDNEAPQFGVPDPSCSMYQSCYDALTLGVSNNETTYQQALVACSGDPVCIRAADRAKAAELEGIRKIFSACLNGNTNCSLVPISGTLPDLIVSGDGANCEAQVDNPGPVVAENCAAFILTNDNANATNALGSGIYPEGTTTVTWTATDQFGNVSMITRNIIVTSENCGNQYCESSGNSTYYEWIKKVRIKDINNNSGDNGGYADFTTMSTDLYLGQAKNITLKPGFSGGRFKVYWRVWVDWNQDGDFNDAGEKEVQKKSRFNVFKTISVPNHAMLGVTRMRVSMKYGGYANPCQNFQYGEVEDYTIVVNSNSSQRALAENSDELNLPAHIKTNGVQDDWNTNVVDAAVTQNNIQSENFNLRPASLSLYPNPASDEVFINGEEYKGEWVQIKVVNNIGQVMYSSIEEVIGASMNIDLSGFRSGQYMVMILADGRRSVTKPLVVLRQ